MGASDAELIEMIAYPQANIIAAHCCSTGHDRQYIHVPLQVGQ
jgi:hypothetical protein